MSSSNIPGEQTPLSEASSALALTEELARDLQAAIAGRLPAKAPFANADEGYFAPRFGSVYFGPLKWFADGAPHYGMVTDGLKSHRQSQPQVTIFADHNQETGWKEEASDSAVATRDAAKPGLQRFQADGGVAHPTFFEDSNFDAPDTGSSRHRSNALCPDAQGFYSRRGTRNSCRPMSFPPDSNFKLEEVIRRWVLAASFTQEDGPLIDQLREIVIAIARAHLASGPGLQPPRHLDAEDLAIEFLLSLRRQGNWMIRTKGGLAAEYRRWVTEFSNPAQHELWEIVSTALHDLARGNAAWRLDAPASDDNHNDAIWTGVAGTTGGRPCDAVAFENAARCIRNDAPPAARKWYTAGAVLPKVIAPKDARELTLALLHAAGGAIRLRDLLAEFKRHVFAFDFGDEIDTGHTASPLSIHPAAMMRICDLAHERAALIWEAASAVAGTDLLCDYFIPKHLEERPVTLDGLGDPRRVHERMQRVVQILRQQLALNVAEALDVQDDAGDTLLHGRFVEEAMHILCEKCGCRPGKAAS